MTVPATHSGVTPRPPFPVDVLEGCETALVLFAAAFQGCQDAAWVARAGLVATCVDEDTDKLWEMAELYPAGWEFVVDDVYEFVAQADRRWDVVTADPWTNQFGRTAAVLPKLCRIAERAVVLGSGQHRVDAPDGWVVRKRVRRSPDGSVFWTVLEPA